MTGSSQFDRMRSASDVPKETDDTDQEIMFNFGFSLGLCLLFVVVYMVLRAKLTRLYNSNLIGHQRPRLAGAQAGWLSWIGTVFTVTDSQLLSFAGLDAFLQVQTIKFALTMVMVLSVPMLGVLLPVYYFRVKDDGKGGAALGSLYMKLSILHCSESMLWVPFALIYLVSLVIFYLVYMFYRNYSFVRQAYLKDPSALSSSLLLQQLIGVTGSLKEARRVASLHNRTVILEGVSTKYGKQALLQLLNQMDVGGTVQSVTFINPREELLYVVKKRNKCLEEFEETCLEFMDKLIREECRQHGLRDEKKFIDELREETVSISRREALELFKLVLDPLFKSDLKPKHSQRGQEHDKLHYLFERFKKLDHQLDECVDDYKEGYEEEDDDGFVDSGIPSNATSGTAKLQKSLLHQSTLVSLEKLTWLSHNLKDLKLTLYGTSKAAIVIMDKAKAASAMSQTILSRRPFSLAAKMAPAADDVLWDNLQLSPSDRTLRFTAGRIMFILTNLFFLPILTMLVGIADLDKLAKYLPFLKDKIEQISPKWRASLQGIIAPMLVNTAFNLAPILLYYIAHYQGLDSKTGLTFSVINRFSWFLFFQSFFTIIIASSLVDVVNDVVSGKWDKILGSLRETFPMKSSLFFNMLIQKAFTTLPTLFMKTGPLVMMSVGWILKKFGFVGSTPRDRLEADLPMDFEYGEQYPQYIIMFLQVTLAFMTITPVSLLAGVLYFSCAYFWYRHAAIFSFRTKHESGGLVWPKVCDQVMIGVGLGQLFTLLHFSIRGAAFQAIFMAPLIFMTAAFSVFLHSTFDCRIEYTPQTDEDDMIAEKLVQDCLRAQSEMLSVNGHHVDDKGKATSPLGSESEMSQPLTVPPVESDSIPSVRKQATIIPLSAVLKKQQPGDHEVAESLEMEVSAVDLANPYTNPVLFKRWNRIILHPAFLAILKRSQQPVITASLSHPPPLDQ